MTIDKTPTAEIKRIRNWAQNKIKAGSEPPWAWYQYMKLIDSIDSILQGVSVTATENSPRSVAQEGTHLQLVATKCQQDTSQPRPVGLKVPMPM